MTELLTQVKQGLSRAAREAERLGKLARLRLEIANLQRLRGAALRRAGEKVYQLVGAGRLAVPEEVEVHLAHVREFEAETAVLRAEIASLNARPEKPQKTQDAEPPEAGSGT